MIIVENFFTKSLKFSIFLLLHSDSNRSSARYSLEVIQLNEVLMDNTQRPIEWLGFHPNQIRFCQRNLKNFTSVFCSNLTFLSIATTHSLICLLQYWSLLTSCTFQIRSIVEVHTKIQNWSQIKIWPWKTLYFAVV